VGTVVDRTVVLARPSFSANALFSLLSRETGFELRPAALACLVQSQNYT
jgi:hypothetical protein